VGSASCAPGARQAERYAAIGLPHVRTMPPRKAQRSKSWRGRDAGGLRFCAMRPTPSVTARAIIACCACPPPLPTSDDAEKVGRVHLAEALFLSQRLRRDQTRA